MTVDKHSDNVNALNKTNDFVLPSEGEDYMEYMNRLFENKAIYHITCQDIADLLNGFTGNAFTESAYRKFWKAFNAGRMYERNSRISKIAKRILTISDLHIPFQKPIDIFSKYAGQIDTLQINGDILDCKSISKFTKGKRTSFIEEMIIARNYFIDLLTLLNPKEVVITYGNHDTRLESYIESKMDTDVCELLPRTPIDFIFFNGFTHYDKERRAVIHYDPLVNAFEEIEFKYNDSWWCMIGKTIFCHPKAIASSPLRTAEKATRYFKNENIEFNALVMAHTHRVGMCKIGNVSIFEQGTCCNTKMLQYADGLLIDPQKEGYLYIEQDKDGSIINYNQEILN